MINNHRGAELTRGEIVINLYESLEAYKAWKYLPVLCMLAFVYISIFILSFARFRVYFPRIFTFSSSIIVAFAFTLLIGIIAMKHKERISFVIYEKGILIHFPEGVEEFHPWESFSYYNISKDKVRVYFNLNNKSYLPLPKNVEPFIMQKIQKLTK